jgi:hypothetical protein
MNPVIIVVVVAVVGVVAIARWLFAGGSGATPPQAGGRPERRRGARVVPPRDRPAELQIIGQDFLEMPEVRDISDNGLAIKVPHKFNGHKPTSEVDLLLTLHGQGTLKARGAIRHVSHARIDTATFGVELISINEEDRHKLRDYLAQIESGDPRKAPESAAPATTPAKNAAAARSKK